MHVLHLEVKTGLSGPLLAERKFGAVTLQCPVFFILVMSDNVARSFFKITHARPEALKLIWPPVLHVWLPSGVQQLNLCNYLDCTDLTNDLDPPVQGNDTRSCEKYSAANRSTMKPGRKDKNCNGPVCAVSRLCLWLLKIAWTQILLPSLIASAWRSLQQPPCFLCRHCPRVCISPHLSTLLRMDSILHLNPLGNEQS